MPAIRPVSVTPASARGSEAQQGAALLMRVFDQARTEKRFDDERTLPPDGKLHRDEFPSARFGAIDRLERADGAIDEVELAAALAKLSAADQRLVIDEAEASTAKLAARGKAFSVAFGGFAAGGVGIMGGLLLGGPVGLAGLALGAAALLGSFGWAIATIVGAGKEGKRLFDAVDAAFGRAAL